jgi:hypothetical protein
VNVIRQFFLIGVFLGSALGGASVFAQDIQPQVPGDVGLTQEDIELAKEVLEQGRRTVVEENMALSEPLSQKFWPMYGKYREAMDKVNDREAKLITEYADSYLNDKLSDEKALQLLDELLSVKKARLNVEKRYVVRFKQVLPPKKVVRFFQVEHRLDTLIDAWLAAKIPLAQ